jgi:hypothetical protein
METVLTLIRELCRGVPLCWQTVTAETQNIKQLIIYSEGQVMIKSFFQAFEALFRAVIYLLILIIGLTVTGLGAYIVLFLAIRIGQFLWILIFKEPWL